MRVAIFINTYKPVKNGVVISTSLIREGLRRRGHQVEVFTSWYPGSQPENGVFRFPAIKVPWVEFTIPIYDLTAITLKRRFRGYDVFLLEHPFLLGELGLKLSKSLGIPSAFVFHTQYHQYLHYIPIIPNKLKLWKLRSHMRRFLSQVDVIIVPSKTFIDDVINYGAPPERVTYIPNPVDLSRFTPPTPEERVTIREKYGLPPEAKVLGFIGRLAPEKNLREVLQVFKRVVELYSSENILLVLVGGGSERERLRGEAVKLNISHRLKFIGPVEPELVHETHKLIDVFITCSLSEVKPLAYLEALATGVPIVAYNAQGAKDTIEHQRNGLLFPPGEIEGMARGIAELLRNPDVYSSLSRGAVESARRYSLEEVSRRYEEVLSELKRGEKLS